MDVFRKLFVMGVCLFLAGAPKSLPAGDIPFQRVLVVHSYHRTQWHVQEVNRGINHAFSGSDAVFRHVFMDTKRHNELAWKKRAGQVAIDVMNAFSPRVVIAVDDNAQVFFVSRVMARPDAPDFVFAGVNGDPAVYGYPRPNVTGVTERLNIQDSIELLLKMCPDVRRVLMLSDKSRTTDLFVSYAKSLDLPVEVAGYVQVSTLEEWRAALEKYRDRVDAFGIYLIQTVRRNRNSDEMMPQEELIAELNSRTRMPTVGFSDISASTGILCAVSVSMIEQGYAAGVIARKILEGAEPGQFPIRPTTRGRIQLNLKQAERLGIDVPWRIIANADVVVR